MPMSKKLFHTSTYNNCNHKKRLRQPCRQGKNKLRQTKCQRSRGHQDKGLPWSPTTAIDTQIIPVKQYSIHSCPQTQNLSDAEASIRPPWYKEYLTIHKPPRFSLQNDCKTTCLGNEHITKISHPSNSQTRLQPPIEFGKSTSVIQWLIVALHSLSHLRTVCPVLYVHKDAPLHLINTRRQPQTRNTSKTY